MLSIRHVCFNPVRTVSVLIAMLATFVAAPAPAAADKKSCGGIDMLEELREVDPGGVAAVMEEALKVANDGAIFWRISRDGIADSYLFGTIHLTDDRVTNLPAKVHQAIEAARVVALEVADVAPAALATAISQSPDLMMFQNGQRLDLLISPEAFEKVKAQLEAARLPITLAQQFKPWVISMLMAVTDCERNRLTSGKPVLDMKISEIARKKGVPVVGLETVKDQLAASASIPMEEQVAALRSSLKLADRAEDLRETILKLYLNRRIGAALPLQMLLARRNSIENATFSGFQSQMIDNRNRDMRTRLLPLLAEGNVFAAVGALHLVGESGLVALLRNAGYHVDPIE